jgi:hypothetical protein
MNIMVVSAMQRDDDVVLLRPATAIELPVHETPTACAGAAASYVLRRIAYRAGAYAPGIQDEIFDELYTTQQGATLGGVERWFAQRGPALHALGYRVEHDRSASRTRDLVAWIKAGRGHRGAVLATSYAQLHPAPEPRGAFMHAVGLAVEGCEAGGDGDLVTIDPWSEVVRTRGELAPALERAHQANACVGLAVCWTGWR